ncbi:hypothetical protein BGZ65_004128 [Modicella reniformis]|uniref:Uncharacterized protein n=1 Tax=Modicella reniformis TaxID=1440133 RepID=A0A9P6STJ4_9FUNG|nr:hypothetical protein BGZ65_004128 [Modicella reniformis]
MPTTSAYEHNTRSLQPVIRREGVTIAGNSNEDQLEGQDENYKLAALYDKCMELSAIMTGQRRLQQALSTSVYYQSKIALAVMRDSTHPGVGLSRTPAPEPSQSI